MYKWLHRVWYEGGSLYWVLLPLTGIYWLLISLRRLIYRIGLLARHRVRAPVIVVGNITAGGTGKTPVTIWLARELRERGFAPGIVSRGYGGSRSGTSMRVDAASDPLEVGEGELVPRPQRDQVVDLLAGGGLGAIPGRGGTGPVGLGARRNRATEDAGRGCGCPVPARHGTELLLDGLPGLVVELAEVGPERLGFPDLLVRDLELERTAEAFA